MIKRPGSGKLRIRLIRDLSLTIVIAAAITIFITINYTTELRRSISISYIKKTTDAAVFEFGALTNPIENSLRIAKRWCEAGLIEIEKPELLNRKFIPFLELLPNASALIIISNYGTEYFLMRDSLTWRTRLVNSRKYPGKTIEQTWSSNFDLLESHIKKTTIDPISRIWYKSTLDSTIDNEIYWTNPFLFEIQQILGISASIKANAFQDSSNKYVFTYDLPITRFYNMVSGLKPSTNGHTFLFLSNGNLFDLRKLKEIPTGMEENAEVFLPINELPVSVQTEAIKIWKSNPVKLVESIEFRSEGETWWGGFRQLNTDGGRIWIGTVIPERDLIGQLYDFRYLVFFAILLIIATTIFLIAVFTRKYIRKIRQLPATRIDRRNIEEDILTIIKTGESKNIEFKSTMRMNLKTGKSGKEIEQAWLKSVTAFLNTDGGVLLIGVDDAGEILGLDADEFANDDKCRLHFKNLIKQHIGLEFSEFLHMDMYTVKDRKIILIEVDKSPNPAFLKMKEEEDFYIRSGPSSVKLPVSKVLTYLEQRAKSLQID